LPNADLHYPARFMLYVVDVRGDKREAIPAVTHFDGTGRLQTVRRDLNCEYYRLIEAFGQATGVPVLLNTSFNLKGEPIVNTPREAYDTFARSGMDALVLGDYVVEKGGSRQRWEEPSMSFIETLSSRIGIATDLVRFFWQNKWWWLAPMITVLLLLVGLIVFAQTSAFGPFIYTLF
jgi:hypothetical protein